MQKSHISAILLLLVFGISSHLSAASFEVLSQMDEAYGERSVLVSDDGSTVLSVHAGAGQFGAFLWRESQGIVSTWPQYGVGGPVPTTLSGNGQVIINYYGSTMGAFDASYDGSVQVGWAGTYPTNEAAAIINGNQQALGKLGSDTTSIAWAVSADGKTVVGTSGSGQQGNAAFRWTEATGMTPLGTLPGTNKRLSRALGISPDGGTIVGASASGNAPEEAFHWTADNGMQGLGDLPGGPFASDAYAASTGGNVIVGQSWATHGTEAFIWDSTHGMRSLTDLLTTEYHLDLHGLKLMNATDISPSGNVIVGWASDGANHAFAFRVNLVPEPSTLLLLTGAFSILPFIRRRPLSIRVFAS